MTDTDELLLQTFASTRDESSKAMRAETSHQRRQLVQIPAASRIACLVNRQFER